MPKMLTAVSAVILGGTLMMCATPLTEAYALPQLSNLTVTGPNGAQTPGSNITFTAHAVGNGGTPEFQFWQQSLAGQWHIVQNYSSRNTYTVRQPSSGSYPVTVYALDSDQIQAGDWSQALHHSFIVNVKSSATVTAPTPVTPAVGQPLPLQATSQNLVQPVYQFWVKNPQGQWSSSGNYTSSATFSFTPTIVGTYQYIAYAKDAVAPNTAVFSVDATGSVDVHHSHVYLEDLPGQPYYENDGGEAFNSNQSMTMVGTTYQSGFDDNYDNGESQQANFLLSKNYSTFSALIGLDDASNGSSGTITFTDMRGQTLNSVTIQPGQLPVPITFSVQGVNVLIVTVNTDAQLDVVHPMVVSANSVTLPAPFHLSSNQVYLEDLPGQPYYENDGGEAFNLNQSMDLMGTTYHQGFFDAYDNGEPQKANFLLKSQYSSFSALVGLDDSNNDSSGTIAFTDRRGQLLGTETIQRGGLPVPISFSVQGVNVLIVTVNTDAQLDVVHPVLTK